jgi:hypothetical protein
VSRDEIQKGKIMTVAAIVKAAQFAAEKLKNQRRKDVDASPLVSTLAVSKRCWSCGWLIM